MSENNRDNLNEVARKAANIENRFNSHLGYEYHTPDALGPGDIFITEDGQAYNILAEFNFQKSENDLYQKAVALKDKDGNVFFHFNGTGDGNWMYNAAAYGVDQPSKMQRDCLDWFDSTYKELQDRGIIKDGNVYVTGHSQGGNNAMYVTMCSEYTDKITACVPLDGPGFSNKFVDERKATLGDEYYERTDKIWAYNGENDYVSVLGQTSVIPDGHTTYIRYSKSEHNIMDYHASSGLIDENGQFIGLIYDENGYSDFRKKVESLVTEISKIPDDQQQDVAKAIMAICENYIGDPDDEPRMEDLTAEEFEAAKKALAPILANFLADDPDSLVPIICNLTGMDSETANTVVNVIKEFGKLPESDREALISSVLDLVTIENNQFSLDMTKIHDTYSVISEMVKENYIYDPEKLMELFEQMGVKEKPLQFVGTVLTIVVFRPVDWLLERVTFAIDAITTVLEKLGIDDAIHEFIVNIFNAVINAISAIGKWFNDTFNKGAKYVKQHPYFKADTDRLYHYASRLDRVNRRLRNLDSGMRSLYWQVGFLDLWDILCANLLTSESYSLNRAKNYLTNTAERLSIADSKARGYLEG